MTLDQFTVHMQDALKAFEKNWRKENQKNSEEWPMEFESQFDWEEQFNAWLG